MNKLNLFLVFIFSSLIVKSQNSWGELMFVIESIDEN